MWAVGGFSGYGGCVWVMGEWAVSQWIVGITSFQKIYGLYGLNILPKVLEWKSWSVSESFYYSDRGVTLN